MCPAMQRAMQRNCAVFRNGKLLADGLSALDDVIAMVWDDTRPCGQTPNRRCCGLRVSLSGRGV
jgi:succinate dehydrogenase/fumarate reductase flavoprotein subunit